MSAGGYGMALSALGGVLQSVAAEQAQEKANQVFQDMLMRQQRLGQQAYQTWETGAQHMGVETARDQMAQGQAQRENLYSQVDATSSSPTGPGANARDSAFGKASGAARAKLGSYSDWQVMQGLERIRTQNELNKISNFSKGWESVLPLQIQDAEHSQDELAFWGNLLSSVGGGAANFSSTHNAGQPASSNVYSIPSSRGYDFNPSPSIDESGNAYSPYSILS